MRKILSIFLLFTVSVCNMKAAEVNDTVKTFYNPEEVDIILEGNSIQVDVKGNVSGFPYTYTYNSSVESADDDWEVNLPFSKSHWERKRRNYFTRMSVDWFDNFYVGGIFHHSAPKGTRGGWEIGVDNLIGLYWHTGRRAPVISLGFGMGYRSTNFGHGMMLGQEEKRLVVMPVPEDCVSASSRLHLFRLSIPLMITQPLGCGLALRVGAILNLNTYTSATTKIKSGNRTNKESFHSLEQRFATPDFFGSIVLCNNFGVYVRWSPMPLFSQEWGPSYKVISVGANFVLKN